MFGEEELVKYHKARAITLSNLVALAFAIVFARLWYLQIYNGKVLLDYSLRNRLRQEVVQAPRGMIFSRDSYLMVDNIPRFDAVLTPQYLKNKKTTLARLAQILNMPVESIRKILAKNST